MQEAPAIAEPVPIVNEKRLRRGGILWIGKTSIRFVRYEAGEAVFDVGTDEQSESDSNPVIP